MHKREFQVLKRTLMHVSGFPTPYLKKKPSARKKLYVPIITNIYYIFKCGLHYLAMFKIFQGIIFAC